VVRVYLPSELNSHLNSLKNMTGLSESEILRHAFLQYLINENMIEKRTRLGLNERDPT
jgi:predicted DNA-binding protein